MFNAEGEPSSVGGRRAPKEAKAGAVSHSEKVEPSQIAITAAQHAEENEDADGDANEVGGNPSRTKRLLNTFDWLDRWAVKIRILLSLYQVLSSLGEIFAIPNPRPYHSILS